MMYYVHKFCVICLKKGNELNNLFQTDDNGITYYQKLTTTITEMGYKELNVHTSICRSCCRSIEKIYNFRKNCLRSKTILSDHISKLNVNNNEPFKECNKLTVTLSDYKRDTKTKLFVKLSKRDSNDDDVIFNNTNGEYSSYNCELLYKGMEPKPVLSRVYFTNIKINNLDILGLDNSETCQQLLQKYNDYDSRSTQDSNVTDLDVVRVYFEDCGKQGIVKYESNIVKGCSVVLEKIRVEDYIWENTYADVNLEDALWPEEESNKQQLEQNFACYICFKRYYKECGLFSHMVSHLRRTPYVCSVCYHRFPTYVHLDNHFNTHPINKKATYFCHICKSEIPDLDLYTSHREEHKNEPPPKEEEENVVNATVTEKCNSEKPVTKSRYFESIATNSYYTAAIVDEDNEAVSEISNEAVNAVVDITNTTSTENVEANTNGDSTTTTTINPPETTATTTVTTTTATTATTVTTATTETTATTTTSTITITDILKPPESSDVEKPKPISKIRQKKFDYVCDLCARIFLSDASLDKHLLNWHTQTDGVRPEYKCRWCPITFYSDYRLKQHETSHSGQNNYTCAFCPKAFNTLYRITVHERIHKGIFPYECSACRRKYHEKNEIKRHLRKGRCKGPQALSQNGTDNTSNNNTTVNENGEVVVKKKKKKVKKKKDGSILKNLLEKNGEKKEQVEMVTPMLDLMEHMHDIQEAFPNPELDKSDEVAVEIVPDFDLIYDEEDAEDDNAEDQCLSDAEAYFPEDDVYEFNPEDEEIDDFASKQNSTTDAVPSVDKNNEHEYIPLPKQALPSFSVNQNNEKSAIYLNFDLPNEIPDTDKVPIYKINEEIPQVNQEMPMETNREQNYSTQQQETMSFSNLPQYMAYANRQNAETYRLPVYRNDAEMMKQMKQNTYSNMSYETNSSYGNVPETQNYTNYQNRLSESYNNRMPEAYNYNMNQKKQYSNKRTNPVDYNRVQEANNFNNRSSQVGYGNRASTSNYPPVSDALNYMNQQPQYPNPYSNASQSVEQQKTPAVYSNRSTPTGFGTPEPKEYANRPSTMSYSNRSTPTVYPNESSSYNQYPSIDFSTEPTYMGYSNMYGSKPESFPSRYGQYENYQYPPRGYGETNPYQYNSSHYNHPAPSYNATASSSNYNQTNASYGHPYTRPISQYGQSSSNYHIPTHQSYTNQPSASSYVSRPTLNPFPPSQTQYGDKQMPNYNYPMQYKPPGSSNPGLNTGSSSDSRSDAIKNMIASNLVKLAKTNPFYNNSYNGDGGQGSYFSLGET